jgi:hypothetical protein
MQQYLYRLYSLDNELLYVGITNNLDQRFTYHRSVKSWWPDVATINIAQYSDRDAVLDAERLAILSESPKYNELVTTKKHSPKDIPEKRYPTTHAKLPLEEIEYLKTLNGEPAYMRAAELQQAGWSVMAILDGVRVSPTPVELRNALKFYYDINTGVDVPIPPKSKRLLKEERASMVSHMTPLESAQIKELAQVAKKYRPQYRPGHPIADVASRYTSLIKDLHARGVPVREIADAAQINESGIRRRLKS